MQLKNAFRQIGVLGALTGVTVLLTVLFSFLGTLSAAVVTGMMMGSARRWQWPALPISLVFPAVILGLSYYSKIALPPEKVYRIALVSGVAFWGVYGMMFCLHFLEQKEAAPSATPAGSVGSKGGTPGTETDTGRGLSLASLCGSWNCEKAADGSGHQKTLQIEDGKFVLSVNGPSGRWRVVARGGVSVDQSRTDKRVINLSEQRDTPDGI